MNKISITKCIEKGKGYSAIALNIKWTQSVNHLLPFIIFLIIYSTSYFFTRNIAKNISNQYYDLIMSCWLLGFFTATLHFTILFFLFNNTKKIKQLNNIQNTLSEHTKKLAELLGKKNRLLTRGINIINKFNETEDRDCLQAFHSWKEQHEAVEKDNADIEKEGNELIKKFDETISKEGELK